MKTSGVDMINIYYVHKWTSQIIKNIVICFLKLEMPQALFSFVPLHFTTKRSYHERFVRTQELALEKESMSRSVLVFLSDTIP